MSNKMKKHHNSFWVSVLLVLAFGAVINFFMGITPTVVEWRLSALIIVLMIGFYEVLYALRDIYNLIAEKHQ